MAILKEENRKLKQSQSSRTQQVDSKTPSKREIAALSTEYDLLTKQVQDLKVFIKQNEGVTELKGDKRDTSSTVKQLEREKKEIADQRDDLEE